MTEAQEFVDRSESSIFDRKAAEYDVKKVANTLIAFANADGGSVVLGIKDRKLEGVDHLSNKRKNDLIQAGFDLVIPKLKVEHKYVKYINTDGSEGNLLVLSVAPSSDIIYTNTKDEVYLRVGDETKKLGYEDRRQLEFDRGIRNYESTVIKDALLDDLDADMVEEYKKLYDFEGDDIWKLLFSRGLAKRTKLANGSFLYQLTIAGVLLLSEKPTIFVPGARIRFIRYAGRKTTVGKNMDVIKEELIEGPIPKLIQKTIDVVSAQLRTFTTLNTETGKFTSISEYPANTWEEGVVNAVTHRAYNLNGDDIRVIMYDDRISIHSPGGLPSVITKENMRTQHYSRNPYIARTLVDIGWVKEFGEGVNRIFEEMQEFYLDDPEYIVTNTSTDLVLKNNIVMRTVRRDKALQNKLGKVWDNLTFVEQMAIVQVYEHGEVRTKSLAESNDKISVQMARRALKNLTDKKILKRIATAPTAPNQYYVLAEDK